MGERQERDGARRGRRGSGLGLRRCERGACRWWSDAKRSCVRIFVKAREPTVQRPRKARARRARRRRVRDGNAQGNARASAVTPTISPMWMDICDAMWDGVDTSAPREGRGSGLSNLGTGTRGAIFFASRCAHLLQRRAAILARRRGVIEPHRDRTGRDTLTSRSGEDRRPGDGHANATGDARRTVLGRVHVRVKSGDVSDAPGALRAGTRGETTRRRRAGDNAGNQRAQHAPLPDARAGASDALQGLM